MNPTYELRVQGHLDDHWSLRLGHLAVSHHEDGTSTLTGPVADQAQLHGILTGLRDLGASLISVRQLGELGELRLLGELRDARAADDGASDLTALQRISWPVRTRRLTLRPARPEDADATGRFRRLEPVCRWLTELPTDPTSYRLTFTDPARLPTTLLVERDGQVIGDLVLRVGNAWSQAEMADQAWVQQAELGWALDPGFTGNGFATEAVRGLLGLCFEGLGLRRVTATCCAANERSWRLMERVGMRRELHAVGDALHRSGQWLDTYGYALLATEWPPLSAGG